MSGSRTGSWTYLAIAVGLFLVWSNSFIAASYLLGGEHPAAQFDWRRIFRAKAFAPAPRLRS